MAGKGWMIFFVVLLQALTAGASMNDTRPGNTGISALPASRESRTGSLPRKSTPESPTAPGTSGWKTKRTSLRSPVPPDCAIPRWRCPEEPSIAQYCDAHFGPDKFGVENFPARMARICCKAMAGRPRHRALDLGCAVGRASSKLARRPLPVRRPPHLPGRPR